VTVRRALVFSVAVFQGAYELPFRLDLASPFSARVSVAGATAVNRANIRTKCLGHFSTRPLRLHGEGLQ